MKRSATFAGLLALTLLMISVASHAQVSVGISVRVGPPPLPVYVQPPVPAPGYIWTPGYWAYGPDGYYWVPGTWVEPPAAGLLWTPGYWGWNDGLYVWHAGYWGPHVGFYGGINYGFGYTSVGFFGGYWRGGVFSYNRSVTNVNIVNIHNTYNQTVINNTTINRVSYNGGAAGIRAFPTAEERRAANDRHFEPTAVQFQHHQAAASNRELLASVNHGRPGIAASPRPGAFRGPGVVGTSSHQNFQQMSPKNAGPRSAGNDPRSRNRFETTPAGSFRGANADRRTPVRNDPRSNNRSNNNARFNEERGNFGHGHDRPGGQQRGNGPRKEQREKR